jgi:hypothetical protein
VIILSNQDQHKQPNQGVKLYEEGKLVNFRLTKGREDIRLLLNEKKLNGIDVSEYMAYCVRKEAGLPMPTAGVVYVTAPAAPAPVERSKEELEAIAEMVFKMVKSSGLAIGGADSTAEQASEGASEQDEQMKKKLKEVANNMLGFLGSDDDDDDD